MYEDDEVFEPFAYPARWEQFRSDIAAATKQYYKL